MKSINWRERLHLLGAPTMAYTKRLRPRGVPFQDMQVNKREGISRVEVNDGCLRKICHLGIVKGF